LNLRVPTVEEVPKYAKDSTVMEVPKISEVSPKDNHVNVVEKVPTVSVTPITDIW
jgi:hypothetical protein